MSSRARGAARIPLDHPATWDDLLAVPEDAIGEIINGELIVSPRPGLPHTRSASGLGVLVGGPFGFGIGGPGGWVIFDEPRLKLGAEIRVPDLTGWRRERWMDLPRKGPIPLIPDWICEVLSPRTEQEDRTTKRDLYAQHKVRHLWLLDPEARTLEVYRLEERGWLLVSSHAGDVSVRAEPFDAVAIDLSLLWGPHRPEDDIEEGDE